MSEIFDNLVLLILFFSGYTVIVSIVNLFSFQRPKPLTPNTDSLISIIIPCRNEEENIEASVESILNQDYKNFELLLIDDNSTDNTWKIIDKLSKKYSKIKSLKGKKLPDNWAGKNWQS